MNYFEIEEIEVFVDISQSNFQYAPGGRINQHRGLTGDRKWDFFHQLTVQGVVSPYPHPPVAYTCCISIFSKHYMDRPNNSATDW